MTKKNLTGTRSTVKRILNRNRAYRISTYTRLVGKVLGRKLERSELMTCLNHMVKEGQFKIVVSGNYVYNYSMV